MACPLDGQLGGLLESNNTERAITGLYQPGKACWLELFVTTALILRASISYWQAGAVSKAGEIEWHEQEVTTVGGIFFLLAIIVVDLLAKMSFI